MLPAGMELRPGLQIGGNLVAVGFPGENVPDSAATGLLSRELPGALGRVLLEAGARHLVVDMRNVGPLSASGIAALKSIRARLRGLLFLPVLVVADRPSRELLAGTGVTSHMPVVVGEEGLRAWAAEMAELSREFAPEELGRREQHGVPLEQVIAEIERQGR